MTKLRATTLVVVVITLVVCLLGCFTPHQSQSVHSGGDRIAFSAGSSFWLSGLSLNYSIYVMDVGESGVTRLTQGARIDAMPAWSPQGDKIAYYGSEGLYIVDTDGSGRLELVWRGSTMSPAWSPDGSKIAFADKGSLYALDIESRQAVPLTDDSLTSDDPAWSPDGKQIAFTIMPFMRTPGGGPEGAIAVINADGSGFTQLTDTADGSSGSPDWSPDGTQIVFERTGDIFVMKADGTDVRALTRDASNQTPAWSPDGSRIAFVSTKNSRCGPALLDGFPFCTSELYVMDADGSNVQRLRGGRNERILDPAWAP
jgi:TolB protein